MGHSTYAFLLDGMGTDLEPEELRDEALGRFESYAEHHCDENNYWTAQALVCRDGRAVPMVEPGDDREQLAASFLAVPVEARWDLAWQVACLGVLQEDRDRAGGAHAGHAGGGAEEPGCQVGGDVQRDRRRRDGTG